MRYLLVIISLFFATNTFAAERIQEFNIQSALDRGYSEGVLTNDIPVYFKGQKHKKYAKKLGQYASNKKTNAFNKTDENACQWAFLSAIRTLQDRARRLNAAAVVNIVSNYKHRKYSSSTQFQCGAGNIIAGVALKGDIVK